MEYIFGHDSTAGNETLKVKGEVHNELQGFCEVVCEYTDSVITNSFFVLKKYHSAEDSAGMCYDWYTIKKHNRVVDRTKAAEIMTDELKKENEKLRNQVEALEQQSAFHENLFMELAQEVYA